MPSTKPHSPEVDAAEGGSEELFLKQESEDAPPPYSSPSIATTCFNRIVPHSQDHGEDGEEQLDEDNIDGEFRDRITVEMEKFGRPYDPREESPPDLAAYHPSFAKVERLCAEVFQDGATLLETSEFTDKYTKQLVSIISRKRKIKYDPPSRIAIIGDSGVGKCQWQ